MIFTGIYGVERMMGVYGMRIGALKKLREPCLYPYDLFTCMT